MFQGNPRPETPAPVLPAGRRWGVGTASISPYMQDLWTVRPSNPVFTPAELAAQVWPARKRWTPPKP